MYKGEADCRLIVNFITFTKETDISYWKNSDGPLKAEKKFAIIQKKKQEAGEKMSAKGDYIGFVDSDDWIVKDMYEYLYVLINKYNADISMCFFARNPRELDDGGECASIECFDEEGIQKFFYRVNGESSNYSVCVRLYKKEVVEGIRFVEGKINEDVLFGYYVCKKAKKMVFSNKRKYSAKKIK